MPTTAESEDTAGRARTKAGQPGRGAVPDAELPSRDRHEGRAHGATNGLVGVTNEPSKHKAAKQPRIGANEQDSAATGAEIWVEVSPADWGFEWWVCCSGSKIPFLK